MQLNSFVTSENRRLNGIAGLILPKELPDEFTFSLPAGPAGGFHEHIVFLETRFHGGMFVVLPDVFCDERHLIRGKS